MQRECDVCRKTYEAKRASSKFCSSTCRQRAYVSPVVVDGVTPAVRISSGSRVYEVTLRELERAEMVESSLGQAALILASRLDAVTSDTGASLAAVVREHRAALSAAVDAGKVAADPLDELAKRRSERRARA